MTTVNRCSRPSLVVLGIVLTCYALPGMGQERVNVRTLNERLIRVENVLDQSMLQQLQRIDALQREIRQLRGELERVNNELDNSRQRSDLIIRDLEERLTEVENRSPASLLDEEGNLRTDLFDEGNGESDESDSLDAADDQSSSLEEGGSADGVTIVASNAVGEGGLARRETATLEETDAYNAAYEVLARGDTEAAIKAFDDFVTQYPAGPYTDNAWYWQGEALYSQRRFDEAVSQFQTVVSRFPDSIKVSDAELKIGYAYYEQQRYDRARDALTRVRDEFVGRPASVLARKRLQLMDREGL